MLLSWKKKFNSYGQIWMMRQMDQVHETFDKNFLICSSESLDELDIEKGKSAGAQTLGKLGRTGTTDLVPNLNSAVYYKLTTSKLCKFFIYRDVMLI